MATPAEDEEDEYTVPLQDQRVFGAGLKRKRVPFVPAQGATSSSLPTTTSGSSAPSSSISDAYLSLVLPPSPLPPPKESTSTTPTPTPTCDLCHLPITAVQPHAATLAHQVCLTHSHPPSALDRSRKGLQYLSSYGWDPDSRRGLGAAGEGIRVPVKVRVKRDNLGVGVKLPKATGGKTQGREKEKERGKGVKKLGAKEVREMEQRAKQKGESLREAFYGNEDLQRYLGPGA